MASEEKRVAKLKSVLEKLTGGKNVQNRQLRSLLGEEAYARFEDDWQQQIELREVLENKPKEVLKYEKLLKQATFTYVKAETASQQGRHKIARELLDKSDAQFCRVAEYLAENVVGNPSLEGWFDRNVHFDASNTPHSCPDDFPCVVTSRGTRNRGGGLLRLRRSKRQVKIDAIERELDKLVDGEIRESDILQRIASKKALRKLASN
ncbi:hypothetical protein AKJ29_02420 [Aliiroseovarius crassostreae]|uniref:Uncharacterized protein n=1 Tax=Aliiroseovarius crassostreae TaxID=154981 RepID=A0A0P7IWK8_9RHOB|nr:hypothetical protein [Aliiroseovarius crassostreae]KPN63024.1 hypothetical protein AKJ29_02420 [Aliiroseovarius crassostreae]